MLHMFQFPEEFGIRDSPFVSQNNSHWREQWAVNSARGEPPASRDDRDEGDW